MFAPSEKKKEIICEDQRSACESHMPTECIVARRASAEMQYITSLSYGQSVTDFATTLEASSNKQVSAAMPARLYYWSPPFVKSPTNVLKKPSIVLKKPSFGSQRPRRSTLAYLRVSGSRVKTCWRRSSKEFIHTQPSRKIN